MTRRRVCALCGAVGPPSFSRCAKPRSPNLELYSEEEIKAMLGPKPSAKATVEDQLLYWIARAKVAERELERRYYEWLDG